MNRLAKTVVALVVTCALPVFLAACGVPDGQGDPKSDGQSDGQNCPDSADDPIEGDIKIGVIAPLSGPFAVAGEVGKALKSYAEFINEKGGVDGHQLDVTILDDKAQPNIAVANAQQLISQDEVDMLAGISSTPQNLAVAPIAVQSCVPDVFVTSGNAELASGKYPGVLPASTTFAAEATAVTADILEEQPEGAKLGIIAVQTDTGTGIAEALKTEAESKGIEVLPVQTLDAAQTTAPSTQIQALADQADFLMFALSPAQCPVALTALAQAGWKPTHTYLNDQCAYRAAVEPAGDAAIGVRSVTYLIDPCNEAYATRPDVQEYLDYLGKTDASCGYAAVGWVNGAGTVAVIEQAIASGELTRESLIAASQNLHELTLPLVPDGVTASTSETSMNPWDSVSVVEYGDGGWKSLSAVKVK